MKSQGNGKIKFLKSAVTPEQFPAANRVEVAILGRSNAGKSSLINAMYNMNIAKVSSTPGKTTLLNFFDVGEHYRMVDMPGYGFAKRSNKEMDTWRPMIEDYIANRDNLIGMLLVMDVRRDWTEMEANLVEWLNYYGKQCCLILTKADKLGTSKLAQAKKKIKEKSGVQRIFCVSSLKKKGMKEVEDFIYKSWVMDDNIEG